MKKVLFEERIWNYMNAKDVINETEDRLAKNSLGIIAALVALVLDFVLLKYFPLKSVALCGCVVFALLAYYIGGVLKISVRLIIRVGFESWYFNPINLLEIAVRVTVVLLALACFVFLPIVFMVISRKQISKDSRTALIFLKRYNMQTIIR